MAADRSSFFIALPEGTWWILPFFIRVRLNRGQYSAYWPSRVPIFTSSYQFSKSSLFFQLFISTPPQPMVELSLSNLKDGILRNLGLRSSIYATISSRAKRCFRCHGEFFVLMFASHVSRHHWRDLDFRSLSIVISGAINIDISRLVVNWASWDSTESRVLSLLTWWLTPLLC